MPNRTKEPSPVETYRHQESKRTNLPTDQTTPYMTDAERKPVFYNPPLRNRSGPLLSWDRSVDLESLTIPATPIYIHEKIDPPAFAESLRTQDITVFPEFFNGFPADAAYSSYRYQGNWQNRIIRGEACHVMASLLAKEAMAGKVQMIFFDPPYGISFKSNMQADARKRGKGEAIKDIPNDPTLIKAFRDSYENGIHSYLDNIFRIAIHARELIHKSGSFFLQIGPANVHRLALLLDEVFGAENHVATIPFAKSGGTSSRTLPQVADYLLWYARDLECLKYRKLFEHLNRQEIVEHMSSYAMVELQDGKTRKLTKNERADPSAHLPTNSRLYSRMRLASPGHSTTGRSEPYFWNGVSYECPSGEQWRVSMDGLHHLDELGRLDSSENKSTQLRWKRYEKEVPGRQINNLWHSQMSPSDMHYVVETAESVIERCILMATDPGDLVLDPTCGSGTTAFVAEKWGRRWITTDCSTVAVTLARQRILAGVFDYHLLQDSKEGSEREAVLAGRKPELTTDAAFGEDPAKGFVYERVPTVSAAILAYDLDEPPTLLYNRPLRKNGIRRVSSAFTVESHSPYRIIHPSDANPALETDSILHRAMVSALESAGIRDGDKHIKVSDIQPYPGDATGGSLITHTGHTSGGRAAIAIARDDASISTNFINRAAEEAVQYPSIDQLIIIGFHFEADAFSERTQIRGRLTIHKAHANQDFRVGNLKADRQHHAFTRIGEPSLEVHSEDFDRISVEVTGHDSYDPATGQLASSDASDIHCWMIDTNYNGTAFFAHRIHFPGADKDKQLTRFATALGKRIDPVLWKHAMSTRSAPFPRPDTGRISVRIITNTHTEMTTVIDIGEQAARTVS